MDTNRRRCAVILPNVLVRVCEIKPFSILLGMAVDARKLGGGKGHGCRGQACGDHGHDARETRHGVAARAYRDRRECVPQH